MKLNYPYFLFSLFILSINPPVIAQVPTSSPLPESIYLNSSWNPFPKSEKLVEFLPAPDQTSRSFQDTCEDRIEYTAAKLTEVSALSFGSELTSREFGQRFSAPKEITLKGFRLFAYAGSGTDESFTYSLSSNVFYVDENGNPEATPIFTDTCDLILNGTPTQDADVIHDINFSAPVSVDRPFMIGVKINTETAIPMVAWTNSWENQDGRGEGNSFTFFEGIGWSSNINSQIGGVALDMDYLIFPFVSYEIETTVPEVFCVEPGQPTSFPIEVDPLFFDPMYNFSAFLDSIKENFFWDFGDGITEKSVEPLHTYSTEFIQEHPTFEVILLDTLIGWTGFWTNSYIITAQSPIQVELECQSKGLLYECAAIANQDYDLGIPDVIEGKFNDQDIEFVPTPLPNIQRFSGFGIPGDNRITIRVKNKCYEIETVESSFKLMPIEAINNLNNKASFAPPEQVFQPFGIEPATGLENRIVMSVGYTFDAGATYLQLFTYDQSTDTVAWAGKNIPLVPPTAFFDEPTTENVFDIAIDGRYGGFLGEKPISSFSLGFYVTDTIETEPLPVAPSELVFTYEPDTLEINYGRNGEVRDSTETFLVQPEDTILDQRIIESLADTLCYVFRAEYPNIDLDNSTFFVNNSGYAGDLNACAPAGVSNGFQWLESQFPIEIKSGLSHREKLEQLSEMMKRPIEEGAFPKDIISAKLTFSTQNQLPVIVKFQHNDVLDDFVDDPSPNSNRRALNKKVGVGPTGNTVDFNWILSEMKHGEALEASYTIYKRVDDDWKNIGAHLVAINGVYFGKDGKKGIWISDDLFQDKRKGLRNVYTELTPVQGLSERAGWLELTRFTDGQYKRVLKGIYSQSLDSSQLVTAIPNFLGEEPANYRVFPNPSSLEEGLFLEFSNTYAQQVFVELRDITGKRIAIHYVPRMGPGEHRLPILDEQLGGEKISPGWYLLRIQSDRGVSWEKVQIE